MAKSSSNASLDTGVFFDWAAEQHVGDVVQHGGICSRLVMRPSSKKRIMWDLASFGVMFWDVVLLPLQAFDLPYSPVVIVVDLAITLFWTLDIVLSFFLGYSAKGVTEMRLLRVCRRYFQTWFLFDCIIVSFDWALILGVDEEVADYFGMARAGKMMRLLRAVRLIRLLRILKVMQVAEQFSDLIQSESLATLFGVIRLIIGVVTINHCIACLWYAIGASGFAEDNWVQRIEEEYVGSMNISFLYSTCLHWSLTQFTPASMEIVPRNAYERVFAIMVIIFALVVFSSVVSSITSEMAHLRRIKREELRQQELTRRYITERKFTLDLGSRINSFVRHQFVMKKAARVREQDISAFADMPELLKVEVHAQAYMPLIVGHPMLHQCVENDVQALVHICHQATDERALSKGHQLFQRGETATFMSFVMSGQAEYIDGAGTPFVVPAFFCEVALWVQWKHRGRLTATSHTELLLIRATYFGTCMAQSFLLPTCRNYAQGFAERLANSGPKSDLWPHFDEAQELAQHAFEGLEGPAGIEETSPRSPKSPKSREGSPQKRRRRLSRKPGLQF